MEGTCRIYLPRAWRTALENHLAGVYLDRGVRGIYNAMLRRLLRQLRTGERPLW